MISPALTRVIEQVHPLFDRSVASALTAHWDSLPKPHASLGRLEDLVTHYGIVKGTAAPALRRKGMIVFAADHGVVTEEVTREAQDETRREARQFLRGGMAVNVLCRQAQIETLLIDAGTIQGLDGGALDQRVAAGSANFVRGPALTEAELNAALETGINIAREAAIRFDIVALAQIGAGTSCSASAMLSAMAGRDAADTVVRECGLDDATHNRRLQSVRAAVNLHQRDTVSPLATLRCLGGPDFAAMTGFVLAAASLRLPVILDGFSSAAAALTARAFAPDALDALMFSHLEPSAAHEFMLQFLAVDPILQLRLTEPAGFGAALAIQLLETGLCLYSEIRDFQ